MSIYSLCVTDCKYVTFGVYTTCVSMYQGSRPSWSLGTDTSTKVYTFTRGTMPPADTFTCIIFVLSYTLVVVFLCKKNAIVMCVPFGRLFVSVHFYYLTFRASSSRLSQSGLMLPSCLWDLWLL